MSGLETDTYLDVDDVLEVAQEQADDKRVIEFIRRARQRRLCVEVVDE
jgi:hypothetical protein